MYTYIYIYMYIYISIYLSLSLYIYIYIYIYVCVYVTKPGGKPVPEDQARKLHAARRRGRLEASRLVSRAARCRHSYEIFTRLAETKLAQIHLNML